MAKPFQFSSQYVGVAYEGSYTATFYAEEAPMSRLDLPHSPGGEETCPPLIIAENDKLINNYQKKLKRIEKL
jgi:hypothetical protein